MVIDDGSTLSALKQVIHCGLDVCFFITYPLDSSPWALDSDDDIADGVGDDTWLRDGMEGDGSWESLTSDFRTLSNISPMTTNEGSTMYWMKP